MMDLENSREQWEQEISDVQDAITPARSLRAAQILAKRASATAAPIRDRLHLIRFLLSPLLLAGGFLILSADIPYKSAVGSATIVIGLGFLGSAFNRSRKR